MHNDHKALLILLVDRSPSMSARIAGSDTTKSSELASVLNQFLHRLAIATVGGGQIRELLDLAVIGFGAGDDQAQPDEPSPGSERSEPTVVAADEFFDQLPLDLERLPGSAAPATALERACQLAEKWSSEHPGGCLPLVIHVTAGDGQDEDLRGLTKSLAKEAGSGGRPLIMNCHLGSHAESAPVVFPRAIQELQNRGGLAEALFELSSSPGDFQLPGRCLVYDADSVALARFFDTALELLRQVIDRHRGVPAGGERAELREAPIILDENVQFTVYRPKSVKPEKWYPLLAFAHLDELPEDADENEPDPVKEVQRRAEAVLGPRVRQYKQTTQDSSHAVPKEGELTFIPEVEGCRFNPPRQSLRWLENVHKVEFSMCADASLDGTTARGQISVFLGAILLADIPLRFKVDSGHAAAPDQAAREPASAKPYRKIFASYSHKDLAIVQQFERYAETLGDRYLRDWKDLRAGENWNDRLLELIEEADVFQLFWSTNSMHSPFVRKEWEHAISLKRKGPSFVRPTYWETPLPESPDGNLPPQQLRKLHFTLLAVAGASPVSEAGGALDEDDGGIVPGGDSGIALASPADGGIALDAPPDSGIALDDADLGDSDMCLTSSSDSAIILADDSGIALDAPPDSNIALEDRNVSDSGLSLETDSGISLQVPLDASLELSDDDESASFADDVALDDDLEEADVEDEDFMLTPSLEESELEEESGSQVVALEEEFDCEHAYADDFDEAYSPAAGMARPSAAPMARRRSRLPLLGIAAVLAVAVVGGAAWFLLSKASQEKERQRHVDEVNRLLEAEQLEAAEQYFADLQRESPRVAQHEDLQQLETQLAQRITERESAIDQLLSELEGAEPFAVDEATLAEARSQARSAEHTARVETIEQAIADYRRARQTIVEELSGSVGNLSSYRELLERYAAKYGESPRGRDFAQVSESELDLIDLVSQFNSQLEQWSRVEIHGLEPQAAAALQADIVTWLQRFSEFPSAAAIQPRLADLAAVARRVQPQDGTRISDRLAQLFRQPVTRISFVLQTKTGVRYYTPAAPQRDGDTYRLQYAADPQLSLQPAAIPIAEMELSASGRQSNTTLSQQGLDMLAELSGQQWEAVFYRLARLIHSAEQLDPILQTIWLREVLELGCQGSRPFHDAFAGHLAHLTAADVSSATNWLDPDNPGVVQTRSQCQQILGRLPDLLAAGSAVAEELQKLSRSSSTTPIGHHWCGLIYRDDGDQWQCAVPAGGPGEGKLFLIRTSPNGSLIWEQIGLLTGGTAQLAGADAGLLLEGRPVFVETQTSAGAEAG